MMRIILLLLLSLLLKGYKINNNKNNLFTKSLFTLTEIIGKISNSNNKDNDSYNSIKKIEIKKRSVEEIGEAIKNEYLQIFWATGNMDLSLWQTNATFADPFSSFGGDGSLSRFKQNADNLGKFIINPKLKITSFSTFKEEEIDVIKVGWLYSSFLKLPWTPVLAASGETFHYLDKNTNLIMKYQETWKSNPIEVLLRLLKPAKINTSDSS